MAISDTKVYSIRADEAVVEQLKAVTENYPNASEAFRALLSAHEMSQAKAVLKGQETGIEDFQAHADSLVRAYINALDLNVGTEQRVRQEFAEQLEVKDKLIAEYQKRIEEAEKREKEAESAVLEIEQRAAERDNEANKQLAEYLSRAERAEKAQAQAEKNTRIAEQARHEIEGHLEVVKAQRTEAQEDKKKADERSISLEKQLKIIQQDLIKAQSELSSERLAHTADMNAAEIEKAKAETAKIQAISEVKEQCFKEIQALQEKIADKNDIISELKAQLIEYQSANKSKRVK